MQDPVLNVTVLEGWSEEQVSLAVLGHPIQHSLSPPMHNAALQAMAVSDSFFACWRYHRFDIPPEDLAKALPLFHRARFKGLNLTIPHKVQAVDLVVGMDPESRMMGAVNTLLWTPEGYYGYNTDGFGIANAVRQELQCELSQTPVLLLGAGGAARAVATQCLLSRCPRLMLWNRSEQRLQELYQQVRQARGESTRLTVHCGSIPYAEIPDGTLVINVTALGLHVADPAPIEVAHLPQNCKVYDSTYGCRNQLAQDCVAAGLAYADGLSMLVWQGVRSLEIWSEVKVPAQIMMATARKMLQLK